MQKEKHYQVLVMLIFDCLNISIHIHVQFFFLPCSILLSNLFEHLIQMLLLLHLTKSLFSLRTTYIGQFFVFTWIFTIGAPSRLIGCSMRNTCLIRMPFRTFPPYFHSTSTCHFHWRNIIFS